jgi:hypothetical protein
VRRSKLVLTAAAAVVLAQCSASTTRAADARSDGGADAGLVDGKGCVADAPAHAARLVLQGHAREVSERLGRPARLSDIADPHCFASSALADLDDDGIDDLEVTESCTWGTQAALHLLYFSNHGCRMFAGELVSAELQPLASKSLRVRDLEEIRSNGCAGNDFTWRHHRWDGTAYRVAEEATCHFCKETRPPSGANKHPYCQRH